MGLILGEVFKDAGSILSLMVLGILAFSYTSFLGMQVLMLNNKIGALNLFLATAIPVSYIFIYLFMPSLGLLSIPLGIVISKYLIAIAIIIVALKIVPDLSFKQIFDSLIPAALMGVVLYFFESNKLLYKIVLGALIYSTSFLLLNRAKLNTLLNQIKNK